jgi:hypothetical protein
MKSLLPEDHAHVSQMTGDVFVVEEIDDGGQAWVTNGGTLVAKKLTRMESAWHLQKWS